MASSIETRFVHVRERGCEDYIDNTVEYTCGKILISSMLCDDETLRRSITLHSSFKRVFADFILYVLFDSFDSHANVYEEQWSLACFSSF